MVGDVEKAFSKYNCISISQKLAGENKDDDFSRPDVVQPLLFALQVGIVTLLNQWGIKPNIVLGHSVGEVAAAYCSGLLSLEDAVKVIYHRSVLQSMVPGKRNSVGDFCTGSYWAKNVRQPVLFAQTLQALTQDCSALDNMVFVEISPRKALQRSIQETLGRNHIVLSSVEPESDSTTIMSTVAKLFELGVNVDWHKIYKGYETIPVELPSYCFETTKNEVYFEHLRKCGQVGGSSHPLLSPSDDINIYMCDLSLETAPFIWEHKNNGAPIVPGAVYVELACASIMTSSKPKMPLSSLRLGIDFKSLCSLDSDYLQLKVKLNQSGKQFTFNIDSLDSTHASGTYRWSDGDSLIEEPCISLDAISRRCTSEITSNTMYSVLGQAGLSMVVFSDSVIMFTMGMNTKKQWPW
ncbi:hypothetical protein WMY93_029914 [Mugilogobius chulae]|uniref:PKS/mFAS DH domain-containing protein n=1 Tax=Mugilogobius chulae TaxID=88201 RepID=A0AAW0MMB5_9GOBI